MSDTAFVWLASQSPRRAQLLQQIGVDFRLLPPDADEDAEALEAERPGELPAAYVQRVTRAKLQAAVARLARRGAAQAPILCADTTVALGRRILGKPADAQHAREMLQALSGHTHRVLTAVAVHDGRRTRSALNVSHVRLRRCLRRPSPPMWPAASPSARPAPMRSRVRSRPRSST